MKLLLEITTPIFLGGSDARTLADVVRVPSIRGQVRYWLRAVLGRRVGNNIAALKEAENNLMGHTGASSLVRFQVTEGHPLETADRYLLPHRQNKSKVPMTAFAEKQAFQLAVTPRFPTLCWPPAGGAPTWAGWASAPGAATAACAACGPQRPKKWCRRTVWRCLRPGRANRCPII